MRILTVRQPWAHAIIHGGKNVENRVRNVAGAYRGPVAIHAAMQRDDRGWVEFGGYALTNTMDRGRPDTLGAIIGVVDLVDVHPPIPGEGAVRGDTCSPWAEPDAWHLVLANPRALDEPIPYKGALGLRKTELAVVNDYLVAPWGHGPGSCTPYGCEPWCEFEPVARLVAS